MKRLDSLLLKVFLYGLPLVVALAVFSYSRDPEIMNRTAGSVKLIYNFAGLVFAFYMILSIYLCVRLMISGSFRDKVLTRLTFIRERDEREVVLSGKATKTAFLTSLAILIFLFCLSCFKVSVYRVPPEQAVGGKTGFVSLGFGFSLLEGSKPANPIRIEKDLFTYAGLPVSSTTVILILILWQVAVYNYSIRRLIK